MFKGCCFCNERNSHGPTGVGSVIRLTRGGEWVSRLICESLRDLDQVLIFIMKFWTLF